jgi:signal transduction histidine kinase
MNFFRYLSDKKYLILFYIVQISFISLVNFFDRNNRLLYSNYWYIVIVSTMLFLLYLSTDYFLKKRYYNSLKNLIDLFKRDWINNIPDSPGYEQNLTNELLVKLYKETNEELDENNNINKENIEFISSWVHQIKTPIAVSKLLLEKNKNKPSRELTDSIGEEIDKIEDNVQKILYFSQLNDFANDYVIEDVNLEEVSKECIKKYSGYFINKKIKILFDNLNLTVKSDKKWLAFIIGQIISNSLKYSKEGGEIKITASKLADESILKIQDNGIGIKKEDLPRVFKKSFTGFNGRQINNSTGMGLYLSHKLSKKLGHYLSIFSIPQNGTEISIHFPDSGKYFDVAKM